MDFINKSYTQVVDLFRTMTPAGRITMGLLLSVVVISLAFLFRQQTDQADEYLFGAEPLTQSEIAALETAFAKAKLGDSEVKGNRVLVPRRQKASYLAAAAEGGAIPASFSSSYETLFSQTNWHDSRDTRLLKANYAHEQFLTQTLRKMQPIETALVKINETTGSGFPPRKERRAFVAVKAIGNKRLDEDQVMTIRATVAGGADVDESNVTVTDLNGFAYPGPGRAGGSSVLQNAYAAHQRYYVDYYKRIISDYLLSMYPGAQVAVNAELDKDVVNQTTSHKLDEKQIPIHSTTYQKDVSSLSGPAGGRPGAAANGVSSNTSAQITSSEPTTESKTTETRDDLKNLVGASVITTQKAPLVPVAITATIGIPTSHFHKIWLQRNPPTKDEPAKTPTKDDLQQIEIETIKNIEDSVVKLLPAPPKSDDVYKPVKVVTYTETPIMTVEEPSFATTAGGWFAENWQTLGLFGLAVFGVIFLRGMIRSAQRPLVPEPGKSREAPVSHVGIADTPDKAADEDDNESVASTLRRRFQASGRSLRDELTDLVKEDPDAAANILKLWISDAA